jgi:hypothetical protein
MPTTRLNLPQQFGRFLLAGAFVFTVFFWGLSSILLSSQDVHRDVLGVRTIVKASTLLPFARWLPDFERGYVPFLLRQTSLVACYLISVTLAWLAAFLYDAKVLRKENIL